jgi:hypothetical protein
VSLIYSTSPNPKWVPLNLSTHAGWDHHRVVNPRIPINPHDCVRAFYGDRPRVGAGGLSNANRKWRSLTMGIGPLRFSYETG